MSVYFIATADRSKVKIGIAFNPKERLSTLRGASPVALTLIAAAPGSIEDERAIHTKFFAHRSHCEWFHGHDEILDAARIIAETGAIPAHLKGVRGQRSIMWPSGKRAPKSAAA